MRALAAFVSVALLVGCEPRGNAVFDEDAGADGGADAGPLPACTNVPKAPADRPPGAPKPIADATGVSALAVDEREVFIAGVVGGRPGLYAVPKEGGATRRVSTHKLSELESDGEWLYGDGMVIAKATGNSLVYEEGAAHAGHDATSVFLVSQRGEIVRVNIDGSGGRVVLATGGLDGATLRDGYVYWTGRDVRDEVRPDTLFRVPTRGGAVESVAIVGLDPNIAIDCHYVYVFGDNYRATGQTGASLARMRLGGGPVTPFATLPNGSLFVDAASLYSVSDKAIWRISLATGAATNIKGQYNARRFAVGDDAVYWSGPEGVVRAPK